MQLARTSATATFVDAGTAGPGNFMGFRKHIIEPALPVRILRGYGAPSHDALRAVAELLPVEQRFSCFHGNEKTLIDHILVSQRLFGFAKGYQIFNEALRYHGPHVEPIAPTEDSDHALCVATFGD